MLLEKINQSLKEALKGGNKFRATALRMLLASLHNEKIAKRHDLTDTEIIAVLFKEQKKRQEAFDIYASARRADKAEAEKQELEIIKSFLPPPLADEELEEIIAKIINDNEPERNFGKLMPLVLKAVSGRAQSAKVVALLKKRLS